MTFSWTFTRKAAPLLGLATLAALALAAKPASAQTVFTDTTVGTMQFTVPTGVTSLFVQLYGAGGGSFNGTASGGSGALVSGSLSVTSGEMLQLLVGSGGGGAYNGGKSVVSGGGVNSNGGSGGTYGGGGGGLSAIQGISGAFLTELVDAGAGGGGGEFNGGNGGFNGTSGGGGSNGGSGGTQMSGGGGGQGTYGGIKGHDGGPGFGGGGGSNGSGGGGAGYYGGGGGGQGNYGSGYGGGGGSSYTSLLTNANVVSGGGGQGGGGDVSYGGNGQIVLSYNTLTPASAAPEPSQFAGLSFIVLGLGGVLLRARKRKMAQSAG